MQKKITLSGPLVLQPVVRERKVNFQDRMKIFRLMINIMMYQDTKTSIIQTLLT